MIVKHDEFIEMDARVKHLNDLHKVDKETMKMMETQNRKQRGLYHEI